MKAILKFDLGQPDDYSEFDVTLKARDMASMLSMLREKFINDRDHDTRFMTPELFFRLLNEYDLGSVI